MKYKPVGMLLLAVAGMMLAGCSSTKVHYLSESRYRPTKSAEIVEREPDRPYQTIAIIEGKSPKFSDGKLVYERMRIKARRIGAHAILPFEYHSTDLPPNVVRPAMPPHPGQKPGAEIVPGLHRQPREWAKAFAIRYTDQTDDSLGQSPE
ncbi:MAG: hypothetical protein R3281_16150 [Balneolaceae bacterium]|nr:hypothetical protein [Balneolaceae bacterium]